MKALGTLKVVALIIEILLAIPILGGTIVIGSAYTALAVEGIIHIIVLILAFKASSSKLSSILGIVTACLAAIPFLGWILHVITAVIYAMDVASNKK